MPLRIISMPQLLDTIREETALFATPVGEENPDSLKLDVEGLLRLCPL
jgi:hypothetical protein